MKLEIIKGDILEMEVEAIVSPANARLEMGGGLSGMIKQKGGEQIEKEAMKQGPISVGQAVLTKAGLLKSKYVIHSPTMEKPAEKSNSDNIRLAVLAALKCADDYQIKSIAIPGMGTGGGSVPKEEDAQTMLETINSYYSTYVEQIVLVARDEELYQAFKKYESAELQLNKSHDIL